MKKILFGTALCLLALQACKKDDDVEETDVELSITEQNEYDDQAAIAFLNDHYLNSKGLIVAFDETDTSDDNEKKLADYNPVKLPSGVIYIVRPDAQPVDGKTIEPKAVISIMQNSNAYIARKLESGIKFTNGTIFSNTISGGNGVPLEDPSYYYVKDSVLKNYNETNGTDYGKSFFEIAGFKEGLQNFKAFDLDNSADYNLQGVIIVPSRAAFAKNKNYYNFKDVSFVFNFQVYRTRVRTPSEM